jgi:hypothetical protein
MPTRLVVADTGPLNYLILIEAADVLPNLFSQILIPQAVYDELAHAEAPAAVRSFIARTPLGSKCVPIPLSTKTPRLTMVSTKESVLQSRLPHRSAPI